MPREHSHHSIVLKALLPMLIGLAVVAWLFADEFSPDDFRRINFTSHSTFYLLLAVLFVIGREAGLMWRWRVLCGNRLSWGASLRVTMMCEFTSAVTPTSAGGTALSLVFLSREGVPLGRAASLSMATLMLDQLFLIVMLPLVIALVPASHLFGFGSGDFGHGVSIAFWIVYAAVCLLGIALFAGAMVCPAVIARWLRALFSLHWLRRWLPAVEKMGIDMAATGIELRKASPGWWCRALAATFLSWICRFLVVNALFMAFVPAASQIVVFGRQLVVWTLLTVSPTPGGSGLSEWLFTNYYGDMLGGDLSLALVIAIVWRLLSYYIYLIAGIFTIPQWLKHRVPIR